MKLFIKTGKKSLSVFLAVMMIMSAWVFTVPASAACEHINVVKTEVKPTCTQDGFTINYCKDCKTSFNTDEVKALGHTYNDGESVSATCVEYGGILYTCTRPGCTDEEANHTLLDIDLRQPPIGHAMSDWYYSKHPSVANSYAKRMNCTRKDCDYTEYELTGNVINVYYHVTFINEYASNSEDGFMTTENGTKLSNGSYVTKQIAEEYVLKGESVKTPLKDYLGAYRYPTIACGRYDHSGWNVPAGADLTNVTRNIEAEAKFEAKDAYHTVRFYIDNDDDATNNTYETITRYGTLIGGPQTVLHGHAAELPEEIPQKYGDLESKYVFTKYDTKVDKVYGDLIVIAEFDKVAKKYKLVYHDAEGKVIDDAEHGAPQLISVGDSVVYADDVAKGLVSAPQKAGDDDITYTFAGWVYGDGSPVVPAKFQIIQSYYQEYDPAKENDKYLSDYEKGIFNIYPKYTKTVKSYEVTITSIDNFGDPTEGAVLKIYDSNGLVVYTKILGTDESVKLNLVPGKYFVQVTYGTEQSEKTELIVSKDSSKSVVVVTEYRKMDEDVNSKCGCAHHLPLIGPIYTFFRRMINSLTGVQVKCCPDYEGPLKL